MIAFLIDHPVLVLALYVLLIVGITVACFLAVDVPPAVAPRPRRDAPRTKERQVRTRDFRAAQAEHVRKTLDRHGITQPITREVDRHLKQERRVLSFHEGDLRTLGATAAADCVHTAICAVDDARAALATHHYTAEARKARTK